MKKVGIIMGSDSDLPIVRKAMDTLTAFGVPFEVHIYSAHRTPDEAGVFAAKAREEGFGVLICAAGMAAHLAGAIAARTSLPVIGIPCKSTNLDGMDALLSTVQMPTGVPVATVAINGAANAALLAIQMLGIEDADLAAKLDEKKQKDAQCARKAERQPGSPSLDDSMPCSTRLLVPTPYSWNRLPSLSQGLLTVIVPYSFSHSVFWHLMDLVPVLGEYTKYLISFLFSF